AVDWFPTFSVVLRAKDAAAEIESGKNITGGINRQRPNISRDDALVHLQPALTIVGGAKDTARTIDKISARENVAARVNRQGANVKTSQPIVHFAPSHPTVHRTEDPNPIGSCEDIAVRFDRSHAYVSRHQTMIFLAPALAVI